MGRFVLNHLELLLTGLGLIVILVIGSLASRWGANVWQVTAITAIVVGVLHGVLFWLVRQRQRQVRQKAIQQVREMLKDLVKNRLQSIKMMVYLAQSPQATPDKVAARLEQVQDLVADISAVIDHISEESLRQWRHYYQAVIENIEAREAKGKYHA
ncbi:MAG: hypothetical protein NZL92_04130 [Gloeomargarita sp. SKYG116]|nr:hypothetical protein [Gloeomargarita sp. SKYG116]MCS7226603.1 hypothetical protein [Gloeomargarita sp. SKYB31]MDW8400867.1 hypothetical protein [Gloeomargarita sp. SKYGB_i_bin116]